MACIMSREVCLSSAAGFALADHNKSISSTSPRLSLLIDVMHMSRLECHSHKHRLHLSSRDRQPDWRVAIIIIIAVIANLQDAHALRLNNDKHFAVGNMATFQGISAIMTYLTKLELHLTGLLSVLVLTRLPLLKLLEWVCYIFCSTSDLLSPNHFQKILHAPWNNLYLIYT